MEYIEFIKYCLKKLKTFFQSKHQPNHKKFSIETSVEGNEKYFKKVLKISYERKDYIQSTNNLPPPKDK